MNSLTTCSIVFYCSFSFKRKTFPYLKELLHVARHCTCNESCIQFLALITLAIALARTMKGRIDESCFLLVHCLTVRIFSPQIMNEVDFTLCLLESSTVVILECLLYCYSFTCFE